MNEDPSEKYLHKRPRMIKYPLKTRARKHVIGFSIYIFIVGLILLLTEKEKSITALFALVALISVFNVLNAKTVSKELNIFSGILQNKLLLAAILALTITSVLFIKYGYKILGGSFVTAMQGYQWVMAISLAFGVWVWRMLLILPSIITNRRRNYTNRD